MYYSGGWCPLQPNPTLHAHVMSQADDHEFPGRHAPRMPGAFRHRTAAALTTTGYRSVNHCRGDLFAPYYTGNGCAEKSLYDRPWSDLEKECSIVINKADLDCIIIRCSCDGSTISISNYIHYRSMTVTKSPNTGYYLACVLFITEVLSIAEDKAFIGREVFRWHNI